MHKHSRMAATGIFCITLLFTGHINAQPKNLPAAVPLPSIAATDRDSSEVQDQLLKLLRLSPTLTEVVQRDPSLLANQEYVSRTNPELAQFLQLHPEIARNPDFYLFSGLGPNGRHSRYALERRVWPEFSRPDENNTPAREIAHDLVPMLIFVITLAGLLWLIHTLLQNRRWNRILRLQSETHSKLIDRFGNNQELLTYMSTDAGRRFLEAAPLPVDFDREQNLPGPLPRILVPLQIGVVLTLLGSGLLFLRHNLPDFASGFLILGVVILMPGIGFILSAGITWLLASRLGMIPTTLTDPKDRL